MPTDFSLWRRGGGGRKEEGSQESSEDLLNRLSRTTVPGHLAHMAALGSNQMGREAGFQEGYDTAVEEAQRAALKTSWRARMKAGLTAPLTGKWPGGWEQNWENRPKALNSDPDAIDKVINLGGRARNGLKNWATTVAQRVMRVGVAAVLSRAGYTVKGTEEAAQQDQKSE